MQTTRSFLKPLLIILAVVAVFYFLFFRRPSRTIVVSDPERSAIDNETAIPVNPEVSKTPSERTFRIVTLLPRDGIPAIDDPSFYSAAEADAEYAPDELVLGVSINGESKAYSTPHLDRHEIVNDTLGGRKIAVTW